MAISITRYVNITSGIGAGANVPNRLLIGRLFTTNPLIAPGTETTFTSDQLPQIGTLFGTGSQEYLRAVFYIDWISKNITRAQAISFARWVDADTAPYIYGAVKPQSLSSYTSITNGSFGLTIGGVVNTFTGLDFSSALSLADVAAVLEAAIQTAVGVQWTAATVTFNATRGSFDFVGGDAVAATISVQEGVIGTPIANLIGWLTGAILGNGTLTESITTTLTNSYNLSNNFGSFLFMPSLTLNQIIEAAAWVNGADILFRVMYTVPVSLANAATYAAALVNYGGVGLTISETAGEYPEQVPMMILAATDYTAADSVQNYEFQQFALTPSVSDDNTANSLDTIRVNYYGVTQQAGQLVAFYQQGVLQGLPTSPADMNVYANEIWLKDAADVAILSLLLVLPKISANIQGQSQITSVLQTVVGLGLNNGTISVGKTLTTAQILYITEITQDSNAWYQVQNLGYWLNVVITPFVALSGATQYQANYTLVYSKNDDIRKVNGTHVLI